MQYGLWADVIGVIHALLVLFVVGGQALILAGWAARWIWTRGRAFRFAHLAAIVFIVAQQWLGRLCPLTIWENELRRKAGAQGYEGGFIEYWLEALIYYSAPAWVFTLAYTTFGVLVAVSFVLYPPRRSRKKHD
jgi:hypothetical protein